MLSTMSPLDYQRTSGRRARREILRLLVQFERDGQRATVRAIASAMEISRGSVGRHVRILAEAGLVTTSRGRSGCVAITDAGRLMA